MEKNIYLFYDENNEIINTLEKNYNCSGCNYTFYGIDKNIESTIIENNSCCDTTYIENNNFEAKISWAKSKPKCNRMIYVEFDNYDTQIFTINISYEWCGNNIKIFDKNNMELNLDDKSLFNNGFTKIQLLFILDLFFPEGSANSSNN